MTKPRDQFAPIMDQLGKVEALGSRFQATEELIFSAAEKRLSEIEKEADSLTQEGVLTDGTSRDRYLALMREKGLLEEVLAAQP
ncbi:MAG: hypothetical protein COX57_05755 [Alphaproteobacteria bacterium CG_4_10_14_0_2_um_filter_63_37]|nr:MAG: hypothetical protein COX57_05755 [Alphaproteobacteria bacterium CG_4_10_14_0_2_um_filter_63_37]